MSTLTEEQIAFQIILNSGNARSNIIAALRAFREKDLETYHALMTEAEEMIAKAHEFHFEMIQKEANGEGSTPTLLLIHAEDHLMSSSTMKDLAREMMEIVKTFR